MMYEDIDLSKWKVDSLISSEDNSLAKVLYESQVSDKQDDRTYQKVDLTDELNEMNSKFENI